jgi:hypothetical protein
MSAVRPADLDLRLDTCRLARERRPSDLRREFRNPASPPTRPFRMPQGGLTCPSCLQEGPKPELRMGRM